MATPDEILRWLQPRQPELLQRLRGWAEHESPSGEPERVRALAGTVAADFAPLGCRAHTHPWALELTRPGDGAAAPLLLLGHLDTVWDAGTLARMPFRIDGERVFGPGVYDMKAGILMAWAALAALRGLGAALPPLTLLLVFDEETGSRNSRPLTEARARAAAAAFVLEPCAEPAGGLKLARKGIAHYTLAAHGVAAHAGVDFEQGASAVAALARLVVDAAGWSAPEEGLTVNPGVFAGGTRANVVAAEARAELDVRAWTAAALAGLDRRVRALRPADARVRLEIGGGLNRPPMEPTPASRALAARAQAFGRELGLELPLARTGGGSDGNFTAACGAPTLDGLGAQGAGAHALHEHLLLPSLLPRAALLAALIAAAAAPPAP
jgi:glutamate carboxypeptidase